MIVDTIENSHLYSGLGENIAKALEILQMVDFTIKADGRCDVDGDELFYIVQRYATKPFEDGLFEAHEKYIDIQFVADGEEVISYARLENLEVEKPYDEAGDCALYKVPGEVAAINMAAGMFCVLFPQDGHMPCRELNGPSNVLKVVVKVKINEE